MSQRTTLKTLAVAGTLLTLTAAPTSATSGPATSQPDHAGDRIAIERLWQRQAEAWARGDGAAYAATYTERLDAIIFNGDHLSTRRQFGDYMQQAFDTALRGTRLGEGEVKSFRFLSPTKAIAVTTGCVIRAGQTTCVPDSIQTHVAVKQRRTWLLTTFQNTRIEPQQ